MLLILIIDWLIFVVDQVFVTSLVPNAPVKLSDMDVIKGDVPVSNSDILMVGTCSFRFDYISNPLQTTNGSVGGTPGKVCLFVCLFVGPAATIFAALNYLKKSPRTPKQVGKENSTTPSAKATPKTTPRSAKVTTPLAATPTSTKRRSAGLQSKSPLSSRKSISTPKSAAKVS